MKTILLPGLGADSRMYPGEVYRQLEDVVFVDWPEFRGETSLRDVAGSVIRQYGIDNDTIIGGASLGGMVALEIAKRLELGKVLLIGSARHPCFVNTVLEKIHSLAQITPVGLLQLLAGGVNKVSHNSALSMFEKADPDFVRAMCKAIFEWEGDNGYGGDIFQIHGSDDWVISPPPDKAQIIEGGGHLISMTHEQVVARFVRNSIETIR